ncbi:hypothetical protein GCM10027613_43010 [Microlunatus endophyticus]
MRLMAESVTLGYGGRPVVDQVTTGIPDHAVTVIVGPNGCGKSTLLRGMARLLRPTSGQVVLDGKAVHLMHTVQVARTLGLMPQSPVAPEGITVADLVGRGRQPHRGVLSRWSRTDDEAVARALELTGTVDLTDRVVDELSGGQRQRVWVAMTLAQQTDLLLLDEPTTFLDVAHQIELLDLLADLRAGRTILMVLHDLNLAARYADHLIAMRDGVVVAEERPTRSSPRTWSAVSSAWTAGSYPTRSRTLRWWCRSAAIAAEIRRELTMFLIARVAVRSVRRLSSSFARVELAGSELSEFGVDGPTYDQRIKIIFPGPSGRLPELRPDAWWQDFQALDDDQRCSMRTYTIRSVADAAPGAEPGFVVDFVVHPGAHGPGSDWACEAGPGDEVLVVVPRKGSPAVGSSGLRPPMPTGCCWSATRPRSRPLPRSWSRFRRTPSAPLCWRCRRPTMSRRCGHQPAWTSGGASAIRLRSAPGRSPRWPGCSALVRRQ